jgi:hypothetical protein
MAKNLFGSQKLGMGCGGKNSGGFGNAGSADGGLGDRARLLSRDSGKLGGGEGAEGEMAVLDSAIAAKFEDACFLGFTIEGGESGDRVLGDVVGLDEVGDRQFNQFTGRALLTANANPYIRLHHLYIN